MIGTIINCSQHSPATALFIFIININKKIHQHKNMYMLSYVDCVLLWCREGASTSCKSVCVHGTLCRCKHTNSQKLRQSLHVSCPKRFEILNTTNDKSQKLWSVDPAKIHILIPRCPSWSVSISVEGTAKKQGLKAGRASKTSKPSSQESSTRNILHKASEDVNQSIKVGGLRCRETYLCQKCLSLADINASCLQALPSPT